MTKMYSWIVGIAVTVLLAINSVFIVPESQYAVILQFGEAVRIHSEPGVYVKIPLIESITKLPRFQKTFENQATTILTRDKKPIIVDNYTIWRITNPQMFLRALRTVSQAENRIGDSVYNAVRLKLSEREYGSIISEKTERGDLNNEITKQVADVVIRQNYGIEIVDVRIKRTDLPEENKASVYNRMISDRQSIAAGYLSEGDEQSKIITSTADRQASELIATAESEAKKIVAMGESEAASIYNSAYGKDPAFYTLYRTLESYVTTLKNEPVIMLPIDSPYATWLRGVGQ
jgi:membrane protease subunit HflC